MGFIFGFGYGIIENKKVKKMGFNKIVDKTWQIIIKIFCVIFLFSFGHIILSAVFNRAVHSYVPLFLVGFIIPFIVLLFPLYKFSFSVNEFFDKHFNIILLSSALLMFVVQLIFINILRFTPQFDLETVYNGGITWAEGGKFTEYDSSTCHSDYFYIFPNNLGALCLFAGLFKAARFFGLTDYFFVASVFNAVLFAGTFIITALISKRLFGINSAVILIAIFLITPPFYFIAPVFYTDSLSLIFPVASIYLFLIGKDTKSVPLKLLFFILSAIIIALGGLIKMTVLIAFIAAVIYLLVTSRWRSLIAYAVIGAVVFVACFGGFDRYMYATHLDREKAETMNTPIYYWLDLGVHGQGTYNNDIYWLSRNTEDPEERKELLKADIKASLDELNIDGVINLFSAKLARAFGDGTFALSDFLDDSPKKASVIHDYITYDGEYYLTYKTWCTAVFFAALVLMLFSVKAVKKHKELLIFLAAIFGIMLFLMFWEINSRYITTFIPFIFIAASAGIKELIKTVDKLIIKKT